MPVVEWVGQSAQDREAVAANSSRLLNLYRESVQSGGLTRYILKPVPGQAVISTLSTALLRAMGWVSGDVYVASGGVLYTVAADGTATSKGEIRDSEETTIAGNNFLTTVCSAGRYYVLDGGALTEPPAGAFRDFGSVAFLNNYTLLTERNGRRVQWSNPADPHTLDGLSFGTTEGSDDNNIRGLALSGYWYIFKERSTEVWYPTGVADSAFARLQGGVIGTGLWGFNLVCTGRDFLFFVGNDGIAYVMAANSPKPISSRPVEDAIKHNNPTHCHYYEVEGHKFCVLRFSDRPAWVYDMASDEWHERSEGEDHEAWSAVASVQETNGTWLVGSRDGGISRLTDDVQDKGGPLYRRGVSRTLRMDSDYFSVNALEIFGSFGENENVGEVIFYLGVGGGYFGLGPGLFNMGGYGNPDPALTISTSKNGGKTWGRPRVRSMGSQGEYWRRVILRALGLHRRFTVQIDMAEPYPMPIYADAKVDVS